MNNLAATTQTLEIFVPKENLVVVQEATGTVGVIQVEQNDFSGFLSKIQEGSPALFSILKDQSINLFTQLPNACYSTVRSVGPNASGFPILPQGGFITDERVGLQKIWNKFIIPGQGSLGKVAIHEYSGFSTDTEEDNAEKIALLQNRFSNLDWNLVDNMFKHFTGFGILNSVQALLYIYNSNQVTDPIEKECPDFFDFVEKRTAGIVTRDVLEFVIDLTQLDWRVRVLPKVAPPIVGVPLLGGGSNVAGLLSPGPEIAGLIDSGDKKGAVPLSPEQQKDIIQRIKSALTISDKKQMRKEGLALGWNALTQKYGTQNYFEFLVDALSHEEYSQYLGILNPADRAQFLTEYIKRFLRENDESVNFPLTQIATMYRFDMRTNLDESRQTIHRVIRLNFSAEVADRLLTKRTFDYAAAFEYLRSNGFSLTAQELAEQVGSNISSITEQARVFLTPEEYQCWKGQIDKHKRKSAKQTNHTKFEESLPEEEMERIFALIKTAYEKRDISNDFFLPTPGMISTMLKMSSRHPIERTLQRNLPPDVFAFYKAEVRITRFASQGLTKRDPHWKDYDVERRNLLLGEAVYMLKEKKRLSAEARKRGPGTIEVFNQLPRTVSSTHVALMVLLFMKFGYIPQKGINCEVPVKPDPRSQFSNRPPRLDCLLMFDIKGECTNDPKQAVRGLAIEPHRLRGNSKYKNEDEYFKERINLVSVLAEQIGIPIELRVVFNNEQMASLIQEIFPEYKGHMPSIDQVYFNSAIMHALRKVEGFEAFYEGLSSLKIKNN